MITADLHELTNARHTYYAGHQDPECPDVLVRPWVTVELFDPHGNNVALFIRSATEAGILRDAGLLAGTLLARAGEAEPASVPGQGHNGPSPASEQNGTAAPTVTQRRTNPKGTRAEARP